MKQIKRIIAIRRKWIRKTKKMWIKMTTHYKKKLRKIFKRNKIKLILKLTLKKTKK
jgi:hypothetical protein